MRSRPLLHLTAGPIVLIAWFGGLTPAARAATAFEGTFVGTMTLGAALDDMCAQTVSRFPREGLTLDLPCPPIAPDIGCLPLNGTTTGLVPNCHLIVHDNIQGVAMASTMCVGIGVNVAKSLPSVTGPPCAFGATGHIRGFCDLMGGQVAGVWTTGGHPVNFSLHFTGGIAGLKIVIMTGHYTNPADGHHGLFVGLARLIEPTPILTPGQSCRDKTARDFVLIGVVSGVPELVL